MRPAAIAPAFAVIDPEVVLQFPVLVLEGPPAAHQRDQVAQRGGLVEVEARPPAARRLQRLLAGPFERENAFLHSLPKCHKCELTLREQIVFATLVDDSKQVVFSGAGVWNNSIHLAQNERGLTPGVVET